MTTTATDYLLSLERLGMKFGLENIEKLCATLDHPERRFRSIIVAGTNGKGSVTAMVHRALVAAGHRAARYTSPHLERLEERFVVGLDEVSPADLERAAAAVRDAVHRLLHSSGLTAPPTFFECATAAAFVLFRDRAVEVAVLEVGLGGRLDATNVVTPIAAAITSIDFDHQALLGSTLASIAFEKAGVIKPGIPVVTGDLPEAAERVIEDVCRTRSARLVRARAHARLDAVIAPADLALRGEHQRANAAVAACLLRQLPALGLQMTDAAIQTGLRDVRWPGRLEEFEYSPAAHIAADRPAYDLGLSGTSAHATAGSPLAPTEPPRRSGDAVPTPTPGGTTAPARILLDAAHNAAGARALAAYMRDGPWKGSALVFGAMQDKDVGAMLSALAPVAGPLVCTTPPTPRAMLAPEVAAIARGLSVGFAEVTTVPDPAAALHRTAAVHPRVVVAGSIFLIGPLRGILRPR